MVCGTICCSGLGGPSGCAPSTHREAPGVAPSLPCFFASQVRARWGWGQAPPPIVVDEEEEYEVMKPYFHTEFDEGPDSTLYAGGAMTTAKTAG